MKPLFTLKKRGSRIEVSRENGLICFATVRAGKKILTEYVIKKDMESFVEFLINAEYEK